MTRHAVSSISCAVAASVALWAFPLARAAASGEGTDVPGGILREDTVWDRVGSPYRVHGLVQIPEDVKLTIRPGVRVVGDGADLFLVQGEVPAVGTSSRPISIDGGGGGTFFDTDVNAPDSTYVNLRYTVISNGLYLWRSFRGAHFDLADSTVTGMRGRSSVVGPSFDITIARNVFNASGGWHLSPGLRKIYVTNNRFVGSSLSGSWVGAGNTASDSLQVHLNTFSVGSVAVELEFDRSALNAKSNYWGTLRTRDIAKMIIDANDDITLENTIPFRPILTEAHPDTP